ncbi:MAG: hypothetical protein FJ102_15180 [Deltaproteobacteria bacterium]|nr:hypothetical protein [Deltaproteobacteria bacterium]
MAPVLVRSLGIVRFGSTEPILLVDDRGDRWICKLQPPPMSDHAVEWIVAALAREMGVAVAPSAEAELHPALIRAFAAGAPSERAYAERAAKLGTTVFASRWIQGAREFTGPRAGDAAALGRVLALDRLVANPDRQANHPNLVRVGRDIVAIDHAQALPEAHGQDDADIEMPLHVSLGLAGPARVPSEAAIKGAVASLPAAWLSRPRREAVVEGCLLRAERLVAS